MPSLSDHTEEKLSDPDRNGYLSFSPIPCFQGCQRRWAGGRWGSGAVGQGHSLSRLLVEQCCALLVGLGPLRAVQPTLPAAPAGHACQVSALGTELPQMPVPRGQAWFPLSPDHLTLTSWVFSATPVASLSVCVKSGRLPLRHLVPGLAFQHEGLWLVSGGSTGSPPAPPKVRVQVLFQTDGHCMRALHAVPSRLQHPYICLSSWPLGQCKHSE